MLKLEGSLHCCQIFGSFTQDTQFWRWGRGAITASQVRHLAYLMLLIPEMATGHNSETVTDLL
jgi:hypothetical protein